MIKITATAKGNIQNKPAGALGAVVGSDEDFMTKGSIAGGKYIDGGAGAGDGAGSTISTTVIAVALEAKVGRGDPELKCDEDSLLSVMWKVGTNSTAEGAGALPRGAGAVTMGDGTGARSESTVLSDKVIPV